MLAAWLGVIGMGIRRAARKVASAAPVLSLTAILMLIAAPARAASVTLKDGRVISGKLAPIPSLGDFARGHAKNDPVASRPILLFDDSLRRIFVPKRLVQEVRETEQGEVLEKFFIRQKTPRSGLRVTNVLDVIKIGPWDEHGRRVFSMNTPKGQADIIQGITEVTPVWTKVEGIKQIWDMRLATSSIPREILSQVLARQIDPKNVEERLKIARFYLQSERYTDAAGELDGVLRDFPDLKEQIAPVRQSLVQLTARQVLGEIKVREAAGQHDFAFSLLSSFAERFPATEVAGEILQEVRERKEDYLARAAGRDEVLKLLDAHLEAVEQEDLRKRIRPLRDEIAALINLNTLDRMSAYRQLADDPAMVPAEKLALAISGWLVGSNGATQNLTNALSLTRMRDLVGQYLTEEKKIERDRLLDEIRSLEGADPKTLAQLLAYMQPPWKLPAPVAGATGMFELTVPGEPEEPLITYFLQVPPEYDPFRRYPTVVTLHGEGTTPAMQVEWWAGTPDAQGRRFGQASRLGYIVIAPRWGKQGQREYNYSAIEHTAVLNSLRDACRRFAIDTDRVYLSGHSIGGDAAWDIGLAHPDLWAGVVPVVGRSAKFCNHYWENARYLPFYVVQGELDGDKVLTNAVDLDRYLSRAFNVTVVEYQGRGHEHFSDEVLKIFDWLPRYQRDFFPREYACRTMRTIDNFFWWVECRGFPPAGVVDPAHYPPPRGTRPTVVEAEVTAKNGLRVRAAADEVTIWVAPELVDFNKPITVSYNGGKAARSGGTLRPDLGVLLEDVRTRGDRLHPFWARIELPSGRINLADERAGAPQAKRANYRGPDSAR
ncbi:MAG: peptidase [Pirellulales bacterium]|nr:peptidase [Pirellulales bacterium]